MVKVLKTFGENPLKIAVLNTYVEFDQSGEAEVAPEIAEILHKIPGYVFPESHEEKDPHGGTEDDDQHGGGTEDDDQHGDGTEDDDQHSDGTEDDDQHGDGTEEKDPDGDGTEDDQQSGADKTEQGKKQNPPRTRARARNTTTSK